MIALVHVGGRFANRILATVFDVAARWRETAVEVRVTKRKLEAELFRNRYHMASKNDDDLPIVR